jgi:hypothetical protein
MHWSQRRLCRKIGESLSFPKLCYSMPINMFFIVKNHWDPYFTDHPGSTKRTRLGMCVWTGLWTFRFHKRQEILQIAEWLLASWGLCSLELGSY